MPPVVTPLMDFDDAMSQIDAASERIRTAIAAVQSATGWPHTVWEGDAADKWFTDLDGRMRALTTLMDQMQQERPQVRRAVAAWKMPHGGY